MGKVGQWSGGDQWIEGLEFPKINSEGGMRTQVRTKVGNSSGNNHTFPSGPHWSPPESKWDTQGPWCHCKSVTACICMHVIHIVKIFMAQMQIEELFGKAVSNYIGILYSISVHRWLCVYQSILLRFFWCFACASLRICTVKPISIIRDTNSCLIHPGWKRRPITLHISVKTCFFLVFREMLG